MAQSSPWGDSKLALPPEEAQVVAVAEDVEDTEADAARKEVERVLSGAPLPAGDSVACSSKLVVTPKPLRRNYQLAWVMGRYGYFTSY